MELDVLEVHLCHLKHITAIGQEHIASVTVFRHILILTFLESFQFSRIIAFNPAGFIQAQRFPATLRIVFIFQTLLNNLKLQLPHRTDNLTSVELVDKQLCHTFVHQLVDTLVQLLGLHRIGVLDVLEHFRREAR